MHRKQWSIDRLQDAIRNLEAQMRAIEHALDAADTALEEEMEKNKELRKRISDAIAILEGGSNDRVVRGSVQGRPDGGGEGIPPTPISTRRSESRQNAIN